MAEAKFRFVSPLERALYLKSVNVLAKLSSAELAMVAQHTRERFFRKGSAIFSKGEPVQSFHVIAEGRAAVEGGEHGSTVLGQEQKVLGFLTMLARSQEGLRSGGKPVGFKLCIGHRREFLGICKAMIETGILPDFITVDGAEGGTGAAPIELSNSVGMPMRDGLLFVNNALRGIGLRGEIRVIAAGKIATGFHMIRAIALGADLCNSARGMMFALGCIQARKCNTNKCPVGITTQDPSRNQGLVVKDKVQRVARYHHGTIRSFLDLCAATGLESPAEITTHDVLRRIDATTIKRFDEIYEYLPEGALIEGRSLPEDWADPWRRASADRF